MQRVKIYTSGDTLPPGLSESNYFHSPQLFALCEQTPRHRPYMVTLIGTDGRLAAQMLAVVRYRSSWFPPYYYKHCRIMGEGVYGEGVKEAPAFDLMLRSLTEHLGRRVLYVEVSHLGNKMFGYGELRQQQFFPVRWMSIHNSLHSRTPEERISAQLQRRIDAAYERGVITDEVRSDADFKEFMKLLRHHNWLKPKRYIPADEFFSNYWRREGSADTPADGRLFITRFRGHIIGCSAVVYSNHQAYLWYAAYRRKTYAWVHPRELTIWHAIKDSHCRGCEHIFFMDVGLPFRKNKFRDFILRFGGKPVSTYRWFRFSIKWLNRLLTWIYRN